jgi:DNA invertase Pin-like site-specific DNA recombinase
MKIVAYFRVSTKRQGASGLGLEGQKTAVESLCRKNGCRLFGMFLVLV